MKYKVVEESLKDDFEIEVNKLIQEGWKPLGGMSHSTDGLHCSEAYIQAIFLGGVDE